MDTTAKKVVGVSLAAMCAFALAMVLITIGWFGTRYLQNVRYEQEIQRLKVEHEKKELERFAKGTDAFLSSMKAEGARLEKAVKDAKAKQAQPPTTKGLTDLSKLTIDELANNRSLMFEGMKTPEFQRKVAERVAAEEKEFMARMIAQETERKAQLRKMIEENEAAKRAAKQPQ